MKPYVRFLPLLAASFLGLLTLGLQAQDVDFNKAVQLRKKMLGGEKLTDDESAYLQRAIEAKKAMQKKDVGKPPAPPTNLKPLCDMTADEKYKGEDGGLYGGGKNEPPKEHFQAALKQAKRIEPLDAAGTPAKDGKIVLISMGMSNTTQVFSRFVKLANTDADKAANVVIIDGAQGGMEAKAWSEGGKQGRDPWPVLDQRLKQAGVAPQQVQAVWIKQARAGPAMQGEYPRHAEEMKGHMIVGLQKLTERFPNLRIAYLSSRTYAGYATSQLNPEPYAYEGAFVMRGLISDQIKGEPAFNYDAAKGAVQMPLLLWGPYLWADGEKGRKSGDLTYKKDDFGPDGTHPSASGQQKVAELLLRFMKNDPTARMFFLKK